MGAVISLEGFLSEMRTKLGPPTISEKGKSHGTESKSGLGGAPLGAGGQLRGPTWTSAWRGAPFSWAPTSPSHLISKQRAVWLPLSASPR